MIVIGSREYENLFAADVMAPAPRDGGDLAWLFYTSGTTGRPKGAMLTHRNLAYASFAYTAEVDPVSPGDPILHAAPMSHGVRPLHHGACDAAWDQRDPANPAASSRRKIFSLFRAWPRASMFAAPTMVKRLVECAADCPAENIRTIIYGGAPMYFEDALRALDRFGPRLAQIYGQGESPMTITNLSKGDIADRTHPRWRERIVSAGKPYACIDVKVADEDGRDLPPGEAGEIVCRGDVVMPGYWNNPEATAASLKAGWLHTGDVGAFDADGYLTLKDRSKDLIISGGSNIYPREVEEVLLKHPGRAGSRP